MRLARLAAYVVDQGLTGGWSRFRLPAIFSSKALRGRVESP